MGSWGSAALVLYFGLVFLHMTLNKLLTQSKDIWDGCVQLVLISDPGQQDDTVVI